MSSHPKKIISDFDKSFLEAVNNFEKSKSPFEFKKEIRKTIANTFVDTLGINFIDNDQERTAKKIATNLRNILALSDQKQSMMILEINELELNELKNYESNSTLVEKYLSITKGQELSEHIIKGCSDSDLLSLKKSYYSNPPTVLMTRDSIIAHIVEMQTKSNPQDLFNNILLDSKDVDQMRSKLSDLDETIDLVALTLNKLDNTREGKSKNQVVYRRCAASILSAAVVVVGIAAILTASIILSGGLAAPAIASACVYPVTGMMWEHYNKGFLSIDNIHEKMDSKVFKKEAQALYERVNHIKERAESNLKTAGGPVKSDDTKPASFAEKVRTEAPASTGRG